MRLGVSVLLSVHMSRCVLLGNFSNDEISFVLKVIFFFSGRILTTNNFVMVYLTAGYKLSFNAND